MKFEMTEQELKSLATEEDEKIKTLMKIFKLEYEQALFIGFLIKNMKEKVCKSN